MTKTVIASTCVTLDSSVYSGGGTDATAALQAILDEAKDGSGLHLVMDGAALITHLTVYPNTTIECPDKSCGFYQIDGTDDSMLTNAHWSFDETVDRGITLSDGTYNQNCLHQAHDTPHALPRFAAADLGKRLKLDTENGTWMTLCLEFYGVEDLTIRDVTIAQFRTFALTVGCFRNVLIDHVRLDMVHHMNGNQDGFHFWGPGRFLTVRDSGGSVSDDIVNVGPDELDHTSDITDVLIDGIHMDDGEQAVRLLSRGTGRLDRVTIRNVTGTYRSYGFYILPWFLDRENKTCGNFGNIFIENVDLREMPPTYTYRPPALFIVGGNIECLTLKNIRAHSPADSRPLLEFGNPFGDYRPFLPVEPLARLQKIQTVIIDGLTVTETADDPAGKEYISVFDRIDTLLLRNIAVIKKNGRPGETLVNLHDTGKLVRRQADNVYLEGLAAVFPPQKEQTE